MGTDLLRIEDLELTFDSYEGTVYAINGVDLVSEDGTILGLVGETGCGKSVTMRAVLGLNPSANIGAGRIMFRFRGPCLNCGGRGCFACENRGEFRDCATCGGAETSCPTCRGTGEPYVNLLHLDPEGIRQIRGEHIAMVFQEPMHTLNPSMRIVDQLGEVFLLRQWDEVYDHAIGLLDQDARGRGHLADRRLILWEQKHGKSRLGRIPRFIPFLRRYRHWLRKALIDLTAGLLASVQIPDPYSVVSQFPHEMSGGMQQRILIAIALAARPTLLIADEPTTALDVTTQAQVLKLIKNLQQELKMSVILITHDVAVVAQVCDTVSVMYTGRIVETGPVKAIFDNPLHPYTQGLLSSVPHVDVRATSLHVIPGSVPSLLESPEACPFNPRCEFARDICRERRPDVIEVEPGHRTACFIYSDHWNDESDTPGSKGS